MNGDAHIDELERHAVALGARPVQPQPDSRWRVLLDPAGHPFCITPFTPGMDVPYCRDENTAQ